MMSPPIARIRNGTVRPLRIVGQKRYGKPGLRGRFVASVMALALFYEDATREWIKPRICFCEGSNAETAAFDHSAGTDSQSSPPALMSAETSPSMARRAMSPGLMPRI